jgi:excinuclease ABC subunit A
VLKNDPKIIVKGARQHNLKNIDLEIPKNKFVVFTGVSGSGKSSLAMDTIYAEGQRRYVESLSSYARQFLGVMDKPDVDSIEGLSPAIAIDQKTVSHNPRSTVGTVTEIYDFLRLLYARIGHQHCTNCGREISRQSVEQIVNSIFDLVRGEDGYLSERGVRVLILAPVVKDRKGEFSDLFENLKKQGYARARIDGVVRDIKEKLSLIKTNKHSVDAIISRHVISKKRMGVKDDAKDIKSAIYQSVENALRLGGGSVILAIVKDDAFDFPSDPKNMVDHLFSERFACPICNLSFSELEPRSFSFNSPHGACVACSGLGTELNINVESVINKNLSIAEGGILPWSGVFESMGWLSKVIESVAKESGFSTIKPIGELDEKSLKLVLYGFGDEKKFKVGQFMARYEGVVPNLIRRHKETASDYIRNEIEKYMVKESCKVCNGTRLKKEALSVVIDDMNIWNVCSLSVDNLLSWVNDLASKLSTNELTIAQPIMKEIVARLRFLLDVGLSYLTVARSATELSGGEAQRIRLASQIGSGLSGVLYVLDEPSIGLHQRDQKKLIDTLKRLRDLGNTVLVVEHDAETMMESDYIFDFGPGAGEHGGLVVSQGTPGEIMRDKKSITGDYLSGRKTVGNGIVKLLSTNGDDVHHSSREGFIVLKGASGRNLKDIDVKIPLGKITCVTGVSGSGKSTLIMDTLLKSLRQYFGLKNEERPEAYRELQGAELIEKVIDIDQSPIGRTPKSNPATYTKTFDHIRELFSQTQEAKIRGYQPGRFSFNVKGGRCEVCGGEGQIKIEMQFMPDVYINCDVCNGKRYNAEALEILYKGKNISDVLNMNVEEALKFFENIPSIARKLETLHDVGLGYIKLGQPAPTLSGGEAQRVKLSSELSKKSYGSTLYILDEPTTGLHFADLERLIAIFKRLSSRGATIVVIEHNLDVISNSDWIIDLGPEGGDAGGHVIYNGALDGLSKELTSYTAEALKQTIQPIKV